MNAQNVNEILDALGARFGATGAHLWEVLQRQALVEAGIAMGSTLLCLVAMAVYTTFPGARQPGPANQTHPLWLIGWVCLLFWLGFSLAAMASTIGGALNPEYFALKTILGALP